MQTSPAVSKESTEHEIKKLAKEARKLLRVAMKGGKNSGQLARAGATLATDGLGLRRNILRDQHLVGALEEGLKTFRELYALYLGAEDNGDGKAGDPAVTQNEPAEFHQPRSVVVLEQIEKMAKARLKVPVELRDDIVRKIAALSAEYVDLTTTKAGATLLNYHHQVFMHVGTRMAGVLVQLEIDPTPELERERDLLAGILRRLEEESAHAAVRGAIEKAERT